MIADPNALTSGNNPTNSSSPNTRTSASSSETSCKCPTVDPPGRNLIICIDGTSNKFGDKNTNIVELYSKIIKTDTQLTYYNSGVGTYSRPYGLTHTRVVEHVSSILDLAIAHNISKNIMHAYEWLSDKYKIGDKIFLFGFSRGAYQVRALAGMIHEVGLILPGNREQIPHAFQLYSDINSGRPKDRELAKEFKESFSRNSVAIHFIGVWDTVSSVGVRKAKNLPSTDTCDHVCYFRQALALDERRVKFLPEYVYGSMSDRSNWVEDKPSSFSKDEDKLSSSPKGQDHIKEVWFAGSHSDVHPLDFEDMPLLWMREEALDAGLLLNPPKVAFKYEDFEEPKITDSLTFLWGLLEALPIRRLRYNNSKEDTIWPHLGRERVILPGQKVHASVLFRTNYRSKAIFWRNLQQWPEAMYWHKASEEQLSRLGPSWEQAPFKYSTAEALVGIHKKNNLDYVDRLAFMCSFGEMPDGCNLLT
ncbi:uncharacterized protein EDB91DRAFT_1217017 [Suillus paluster]|uniref:uncharacterized protein n=1 Tax=Suillus paluster TaxID=48578 RepID=UPI001B88733D|nr:uncharacterized protein EDB91DRAFT_1217017 [Suillus paluster]KAG1750351.1 hypothetical protein EDB91DRAFT_1217017 [Suillus paluster]